MKKSITLLFLCCSLLSFSQELTGNQLLEKAITFHDPNNNWFSFSGNFIVTMKTPKNPDRISKININLPKEYFSLSAKKAENTTNYIVNKDSVSFTFNGEETISEEIIKQQGLSKERAILYKNYYTYLYGLPMKLKDEVTIIHQKVEKRNFKGKDYLVLKVTYPKEIGKDTWYFYFNPKTYAMEVYQFFKDTPDSGEYILLSGLEEINGIKMPKNREWYYNKDDKYLGTDVLSIK